MLGCATSDEKDGVVRKNLNQRDVSLNQLKNMETMSTAEKITTKINDKINTPNFVNLIKHHDKTEFGNKITQTKIKDIISFLVNQVVDGTQKQSHYPHAEFSFYDLGSMFKLIYRSPLDHTEIIKINKNSKVVEHNVNRTIIGDKALKETPVLKRYDNNTTLQNRNDDDDVYNNSKAKDEFFYRIKCTKSNKYLINANGSTIYSKPGFVVNKLKSFNHNNYTKNQDLDSFTIEALPVSEAIYTPAHIFVKNYQKRKEQEDVKQQERKMRNMMKTKINNKIKEFDKLIEEMNSKKIELEASLENLNKK